MTFSLYANNGESFQPGQSVCQSVSDVPFLPPMSGKKHNFVERSSFSWCFQFEHLISQKSQCRETSKPKICDSQIAVYYQANQNKFPTIEH